METLLIAKVEKVETDQEANITEKFNEVKTASNENLHKIDVTIQKIRTLEAEYNERFVDLE